MANPTTNFGWQMPTATDLVTDLPADFEVFGQAVDTDFVDLLGGTTGQILSKASGTDLDFEWSTPASGGYVLIGSTTTFSASSSVSIDSLFDSTYTNYKVITQFTCSLNDTNIYIKLRAAGSDTSTNYVNPTFRFNTAGSTSEEGSTSSWKIISAGSTETNSADLTIYNPAASKHTTLTTMGYGSYNPTSNSGYGNFAVGRQKSTTSFDGISIIPSTGTITGTVQIYGLAI